MMHCKPASTAPVALSKPQLCTMSDTRLCLHSHNLFWCAYTPGQEFVQLSKSYHKEARQQAQHGNSYDEDGARS